MIWILKPNQNLHPPGKKTLTILKIRGCVRQVTESDFRRLEVVRGSLGIYYYEVVSPGSGGAEVVRLTESDFSRLEVALSSFRIILEYHPDLDSEDDGKRL